MHARWGILAGAAVLSALLTVRLPAAKAQQNYINIVMWPVNGAYRTVTAYPDSTWTWAFLGLAEGQRCPNYWERSYTDALPAWRSPEMPEQADWLQASQGGRWVACYRGHAGTDIATYPGAGVYAAAAGEVLSVTVVDGSAEEVSIVTAHHRLVDGVRYEWFATYKHLSTDVEAYPGQIIQQGDLLGYTADLGTNTHLHFEISGLWYCEAPCVFNPWGPVYLWIDDDFDGLPDPAISYPNLEDINSRAGAAGR